jgi:hypothetical protein
MKRFVPLIPFINKCWFTAGAPAELYEIYRKFGLGLRPYLVAFSGISERSCILRICDLHGGCAPLELEPVRRDNRLIKLF